MKFKISRKYKMPSSFEMLELGVEEVDTQKELWGYLKEFDQMAREYKEMTKQDLYEDMEFKPKKGTNPSLHENWEWVKKIDKPF